MIGISSSHTEAAGFTLIEMLVVLAIIGLLGALAASQWGRTPALSAKAGTVMKARAGLVRIRAEALGGGAPVRAEAAAVAPGAVWQSGAAPVFYPDGSASSDVLVIGGKAALTVEPVTGYVHAAR